MFEGLSPCKMGRAVVCTVILLSYLIPPGQHQDISRPVLTLHHDFAEIYEGESVTLRCDMQSGGVSDWEYKWFRDGDVDTPVFSSSENEYTDTLNAKDTHIEYLNRATFSCMAVRKSDSQTSPLSNLINITIHVQPHTEMTVSPSPWLRAGDAATLSCKVNGSTEGWTFYWYKAFHTKDLLLPKWSQRFSVEALPDSQKGAAGFLSLSPVNQTHINAYVCRAGRGHAEYFTRYSIPELLWVAGSKPSATLRFTPNRVQHFLNEHHTVSCDGHGNSTGWRVKRFTSVSGQSECDGDWGTAVGSSCFMNFTRVDAVHSVFWCQSDSGEYSDAANFTERTKDVILESPVVPLNPGDSVTLACRYKTRPDDPGAEFYKHDSLISTTRTGEMTIHGVSKSDEGNYWCRNPELGESGWSWLSVRATSTSLHPSQALSTCVLTASLVRFLFV